MSARQHLDRLTPVVLVPSLAAAALAGLLAVVEDSALATLRSLVFLGGPLLLLAGLHGRLFGFLHDPARLRQLPLPLRAQAHWSSGLRGQRFGLALSVVLGVLGVGLGAWSHPSLILEFLWLALLTATLEPGVAAISALLGRRFEAGSSGAELQRALGGGWTSPEAVVHLYAPALGVGAAVLLALPGQLTVERYFDGATVTPTMIALVLGPLGLAAGLAWLAPRVYARGVWEAIPWLAEVSRTLAGPPQPEETPRCLGHVRDPWLRLLITQFLRLTPLPYLRAICVVGLALWVGLRASPPTLPVLGLSLALIGLWIMPGKTAQAAARAQIAGALPLPPSQREGRAGLRALAIFVAIPAVLVLSLCARLIVTTLAS